MQYDIEVFDLIRKEALRQKNGINLIASENYVSNEVLKALGSCLTNKYVEGVVGARFYSGFEFIDKLEQLCIDRFKQLFKAQNLYVNVQLHSGSQANQAVYLACLNSGDTVLSLDFACGGHISHGHTKSFLGKFFKVVNYTLDRDTQLLDYDSIEQLALKHKPKLIIAGYSAYSRIIDFARFSAISKKVGAFLLADVAHVAGLIAAEVYPSPMQYADFITLTTHKTFRGARGAVVFCKKEFSKQLDAAILPGLQGGAQMNGIAAKAVAAYEASSFEYKNYQKRVLENAAAMAQVFNNNNFKVISGGTDTHLFLLDLSELRITGLEAEQILEKANIFVNRNSIPFDKNSPFNPSGIRIGSAAITTNGADVKFCVDLAYKIIQLLKEN